MKRKKPQVDYMDCQKLVDAITMAEHLEMNLVPFLTLAKTFIEGSKEVLCSHCSNRPVSKCKIVNAITSAIEHDTAREQFYKRFMEESRQPE